MAAQQPGNTLENKVVITVPEAKFVFETEMYPEEFRHYFPFYTNYVVAKTEINIAVSTYS